MGTELPPAKNPSEYTPDERRRITEAAAQYAALLAEHLARLVELEEEIHRREH